MPNQFQNLERAISKIQEYTIFENTQWFNLADLEIDLLNCEVDPNLLPKEGYYEGIPLKNLAIYAKDFTYNFRLNCKYTFDPRDILSADEREQRIELRYFIRKFFSDADNCNLIHHINYLLRFSKYYKETSAKIRNVLMTLPSEQVLQLVGPIGRVETVGILPSLALKEPPANFVGCDIVNSNFKGYCKNVPAERSWFYLNAFTSTDVFFLHLNGGLLHSDLQKEILFESLVNTHGKENIGKMIDIKVILLYRLLTVVIDPLIQRTRLKMDS